MSRVLVTGGNGFIGSHVVPELLRLGHEVHVAGRSRSARDEARLFWHEVDLLREGSARHLVDLVGPQRLLHLAWVTDHGRYWEAEDNLAWLASSLELLQAFSAAGGERFVGVGSCMEYDWSSADGPIGETHPLRPGTLYGACKAALYGVASTFARTRGQSFAWARLFFLTGPGEDPRRLVPSIARSVGRQEEAPLGPPGRMRDFLDVRDAGRALALLVDANIEGPVNIASGVGTAVEDVALMAARVAGDARFVRVGALPARESDPPTVVADARRIRTELAFVPQFDLATAVADAVRDGMEREDGWT